MDGLVRLVFVFAELRQWNSDADTNRVEARDRSSVHGRRDRDARLRCGDHVRRLRASDDTDRLRLGRRLRVAVDAMRSAMSGRWLLLRHNHNDLPRRQLLPTRLARSHLLPRRQLLPLARTVDVDSMPRRNHLPGHVDDDPDRVCGGHVLSGRRRPVHHLRDGDVGPRPVTSHGVCSGDGMFRQSGRVPARHRRLGHGMWQ